MRRLLRQFITEALCDQDFLRHLRNGLGFARNQRADGAQAYQIATDWLEEAELRSGELLAPGRVIQVERFVVDTWPMVLEQFHGDEGAALCTLMNMLDDRFSV